MVTVNRRYLSDLEACDVPQMEPAFGEVAPQGGDLGAHGAPSWIARTTAPSSAATVAKPAWSECPAHVTASIGLDAVTAVPAGRQRDGIGRRTGFEVQQGDAARVQGDRFVPVRLLSPRSRRRRVTARLRALGARRARRHASRSRSRAPTRGRGRHRRSGRGHRDRRALARPQGRRHRIGRGHRLRLAREGQSELGEVHRAYVQAFERHRADTRKESDESNKRNDESGVEPRFVLHVDRYRRALLTINRRRIFS